MMVTRGSGSPRRPRATGLTLVTLTLVVLTPVLAGAETSARGELENFFRRAIAIRTEATNPARARDDVRRLALALFDGRDVSRRVLGTEWDRRTDAERDHFARTFTGVLEKAYINIVQGRLPHDRPPVIRVIDEKSTGRLAVVRTRVRTRDGNDAQLDYRMTRPDKAWLIRDVVIDGVSLVDNYRAQLARTRRRSSYVELVERLRTVAGAPPQDSIVASPNSRAGIVVAHGYVAGPETSQQNP